MDQKKLIKAAKRKDPLALERLFREAYPIVFGYLLKTTLDEQAARDLTQETFLRALKHLSGFRETSKFSTWLIAIATNLHKDQIRRSAREAPGDFDPSIPGPENVEEQVLLDDSLKRVGTILRRLPHEKRRVFILKHYYHYTYEEISRIEHCPIGTVRSRLHDCILKLRTEMEADPT